MGDTWLQLLADIFEVCIIPLIGVLTAYLISFIKSKSVELAEKTDNELAKKYIEMLSTTVTDCVIATKQTYVDNLKKDNAFTAEAQKEAFEMTYNAVLNVLSEDAKEYLSSIYGDLTEYLIQKIEAEVALTK